MNCILAALKYILKIARYAISKRRGEVKRGGGYEKGGDGDRKREGRGCRFPIGVFVNSSIKMNGL